MANSSDAYPERPITLIVPFGVKSDSQTYAQILAKHLKKYLNTTELVIENRVGDSGAKAASEVKLMRPDGYTLLLARVGSQVVAPALKPSLPYRHTDFTFLGVLLIEPLVCAVRADAPFKSHHELTQALRKSPGTLKFGHAGPGTIHNMSALYLMRLAGLKLDSATGVGFNGAIEVKEALLNGQIDFMCINAGSFISLIKDGKIRGLLTTAPGRMPQLPELQNSREVGMRDLGSILGWTALVGPPGMPPKLVGKWRATLQALGKDPQWLADLAAMGAISALGTSKDSDKFMQEQSELYQRLVPIMGLQE
ncbi:tripartite tricarboxylate transporter substrate binding protein [Roseateles oligotrophus]|uniref:Tripartite tricarboxylate transporter substrate binding protein n=1 Tax=Roseateles oligotrophus TaxID=1769250 RepID=A0ABT2YEW6_9BURK|nr:tripartite tricarboxylate transporter substrate binding protein [Roseateles oligotrophus]MCV2368563.1 tripartite tricarboxylate transporter substrate binding protein [Roseateles oligotrophus]